MLGNCGKAHLEWLGHVGHSHVVLKQHGQNAAAGRVGKRGKDKIKRLGHGAVIAHGSGDAKRIFRIAPVGGVADKEVSSGDRTMPPTPLHWLVLLLLGLGWGSSFMFNEILLREIGPLTMSLGRVGLGAVGCWIWVLGTGRARALGIGSLMALVLLGIINYAIPFTLYPLAQEALTGGVTGIINAMTPVAVVLVSQVWPGGEKATRAKSLGVALGLVGVLLLALPALQRGSGSEIWAILTALGAPVCYAVGTNIVRYFRALDPALVAAVSLTGGALAVGPLALAVEGVPQITLWQSWLSLGIIGFALTSAAFIGMYWLIGAQGGTFASTVTFIAPVSAVLLGRWVLGEALLTEHLLGMAVILLGFVFIDGRLFRRRTLNRTVE